MNHTARNDESLIASSRPAGPAIFVNGKPIDPAELGRELQYHPAATEEEVLFEAARALVIRELLRQRAAELELAVEAGAEETGEEAQTRVLLEREVSVPAADEATCRRYFEQNRDRFVSAPLVAARHILLAAAPDDVEERSRQREHAEQLLIEIDGDSSRFEQAARKHSACPSAVQGGALGQLSSGQTVPEFERTLFRLPVGLASRAVETRYGIHLAWVEQRVDGRSLPFEAVVERIRDTLNQKTWQTAVAQYLKQLVGQADIRGIELEGAASPLVQ